MSAELSPSTPNPLVLDFAGIIYRLDPLAEFTIGRQGDLALDDNPYLHRRFLVMSAADGLWWVHNVGSRLSAALTDSRGLARTSLAPGARMPVVFPDMLLTFAAGPTAYELRLSCDVAGFAPSEQLEAGHGETTVGATRFTSSQRLLMVALAEPVLRRTGPGSSRIPPSATAAERLGWNVTRFNRKLDNVCEKLTAAGVKGLRGELGEAATGRRAALVEYAVATLLVGADDLPLLDIERRANLGPTSRPDHDDVEGNR